MTTNSDRSRILFLVHPGSCCGSAEMTLGRYDARAARDGLVNELNKWNGPIVVIDADLSDEIASYPVFAQAIEGALDRAKAAGNLSRRIFGQDTEDFDQVAAARKIVEDEGLMPERHVVALTGAWFAEDGVGCVNSVEEMFSEAGFNTDVLDSVVRDPCGNDDDEDGDISFAAGRP